MSQAVQGQVVTTPEAIIAHPLRGRKMSAEHIANRSESKHRKARIRKFEESTRVRFDESKRPRHTLMAQAFRGLYDAGLAEKLADRVANIALTDPRPSNALAACVFIKETVEGKAIQAVAVQHSVDESTMRRIAELSERLLSLT